MSDLDTQTRPSLTAEELQRLTRRSSWRAALAIVRVYGTLLFVIGAALVLGGWWIVLVLPIIAALQHALSILQHEAVHGLFRHRRINEVVGTYLLSYPIGFTMDYRAVHFAHHRALGGVEDPDLPNYQPFPSQAAVLAWKLVRDFTGMSALTQFFGRQMTTIPRPSRLVGLLVTHAVIFFCFIATGQPLMYVVLWLLPLVTLTKGLAQLRNLAEHFLREHAPVGTDRLRTFTSNRVERFFLAPLNFNYHAEHHWYTMIPYYHLPKTRRLLQARPGYKTYTELNRSYISVLKNVIKKH